MSQRFNTCVMYDRADGARFRVQDKNGVFVPAVPVANTVGEYRGHCLVATYAEALFFKWSILVTCCKGGQTTCLKVLFIEWCCHQAMTRHLRRLSAIRLRSSRIRTCTR